MGYGFTFRLYLANGEEMGTFQTSTPSWEIGDQFRGAGNVPYRIIGMLSSEELESELMGGWIVAPVELTEP